MPSGSSIIVLASWDYSGQYGPSSRWWHLEDNLLVAAVWVYICRPFCSSIAVDCPRHSAVCSTLYWCPAMSSSARRRRRLRAMHAEIFIYADRADCHARTQAATSTTYGPRDGDDKRSDARYSTTRHRIRHESVPKITIKLYIYNVLWICRERTAKTVTD